MIYYRPTDGGTHSLPLRPRARSCFLMTQIGGTIPDTVRAIRRDLETILGAAGFVLLDADSDTTGRDFLLKIWEMIVAVPLGIAIVHAEMRPATLANVYYEMGLMQAYGKETLVIRTPDAPVPSDFVRTEYVTYDEHFQRRMARFLANLRERADHFAAVATLVENDPLLCIDYCRRAFLLTGDPSHARHATAVFDRASLTDRARNSVERLLISFAG